MKLLVLGGTRFLGRAIVAAALAAGHEVSIFTRGQTNSDLSPEAEHLVGDRDGDLAALEGGRWDTAIDTCGYYPRIVRASVELLAGRVEHYAFISSVSVYADLSTPPNESSPVGTMEDETLEEMGDEFQYYGPLKALCEAEVERAFPGRALIVRPGLIVGPHDPTDRFTYWPRRLERGGEILAPAPADEPVQFIDVRDLGEWIVRMVEERRTGTFNAINERLPWSELLAGADVTWVDSSFLLEQGVGEWMELPLWIADPAFAGHARTDVSRAVEAGLTFRPLDETIRDTERWDAARGEGVLAAGLTPEREAELLEAWRKRS
ncbi:MAG: NAD-dependent epimerase/dehydratase family protein [Thermoleophilia bacterium]